MAIKSVRRAERDPLRGVVRLQRGATLEGGTAPFLWLKSPCGRTTPLDGASVNPRIGDNWQPESKDRTRARVGFVACHSTEQLGLD